MNRVEYNQRFLDCYNKGMNDCEIAKELNKSDKAVFAYRKKRKLPPIKSYRVVDRDVFINLYQQGLGDREISKKLNISRNTICGIRTRLKLKSHIPYQNEPIKLTEVQKQILVGTLLGDGFLGKKKNCYTGKIEHSLKQEAYCRWKKEQLDNLTNNLTYSTKFHKKWNITTYSIYCTFKANLELKYFHELFYSTGTKQVSKEILQYLTPLAIAVWYMDDGTGSRYSKYFATDTFSIDSINLLIDYLYNKYQIRSHIADRNRIYLEARTIKIFQNLIDPYMHESMKYKLTYIKPSVT